MNQDTLEKEFMEAFDEYADAIFRFCFVKVSHKEKAEDFTQEVFMRYWQALKNGKEMTHTRAFLYTIANNLAKDWYKKKKSDSLDGYMEAGMQIQQTDDIDPETYTEHQEVLSVIADMEERDKEVLLLRHVEGLKPKDIAAILGESANAVSVRLNRAAKELQRRLHTENI